MASVSPLFLVTANVGSIFENPEVMLQLWIREFIMAITRSKAKFVALHCQEVGGKNYEIRMPHVQNFIQLLISSEELQEFDKMVIFIDEDFSCAENFTALGNFYFIHRDIKDVYIWDFEKLSLELVNGKIIHAGNIENVTTKEKSKFPQTFFPECKWSRKGFLRTRWKLNGTVFDLVNIHLFHDASNFIAMEAFPSAYTVMRQKALQYTLMRFYNYEDGSAPFFLFGDFNFRTDTKGVIKKLVTGLNVEKGESNDNNNSDSAKWLYKDDASEVIFTVGKKEFCHSEHQSIFIYDAAEWLKEFDRELDDFQNQLYEFPVTFAPSYPFEENCNVPHAYMKTRCPAWCDRVLLSLNAKQLIHEMDKENSVEYGIIGADTCMGDHKPVFLRLNLIDNAGTKRLPAKFVCFACEVLKKNNNNSNGNNNSCSSIISNINISSNSPKLVRQHAAAASSNNSIIDLYNSEVDDNDKENIEISCPPITGLSSDNIKRLCKSIASERNNNNNNNNNNRMSFGEVLSPERLQLKSVADDLEKKPQIENRCNFDLDSDSDAEDDVEYGYGRKYYRSESCQQTSSELQRSSGDNLVKRIYSTSAVTADQDDSLTQSDNVWRKKLPICIGCNDIVNDRFRSASLSSRLNSGSWSSRIRLKSDPDLKTSLPRIESHHSSSDEEWFEDDNNNINNNSNLNNINFEENNTSLNNVNIKTDNNNRDIVPLSANISDNAIITFDKGITTTDGQCDKTAAGALFAPAYICVPTGNSSQLNLTTVTADGDETDPKKYHRSKHKDEIDLLSSIDIDTIGIIESSKVGVDDDDDDDDESDNDRNSSCFCFSDKRKKSRGNRLQQQRPSSRSRNFHLKYFHRNKNRKTKLSCVVS